MQEIRRIAIKLAQRRISIDRVLAWSLWRRAHQADARCTLGEKCNCNAKSNAFGGLRRLAAVEGLQGEMEPVTDFTGVDPLSLEPECRDVMARDGKRMNSIQRGHRPAQALQQLGNELLACKLLNLEATFLGLELHGRCPTSRDFVPWRFLDAGQFSVRILLVAGVQKPTQLRTFTLKAAVLLHGGHSSPRSLKYFDGCFGVWLLVPAGVREMSEAQFDQNAWLSGLANPTLTICR
jgi:hypothetical protein